MTAADLFATIELLALQAVRGVAHAGVEGARRNAGDAVTADRARARARHEAEIAVATATRAQRAASA